MKSKGLDTLRGALKDGTLANAYIFYGEERYLHNSYMQQVRKCVIPSGFEEFNYHRLNGKGLQILTLQETVEAMPMMSTHTLVEVTDLDIFHLDEQQRTHLCKLLDDLPDYCVLIFSYLTLPYKRDGKMKKLCAALDRTVQEVEFCRPDASALRSWVRRHFAAAGHDIDNDTIDHLLFTCGDMMTNLLPEIEKIAAYSKQRNITREDINTAAEPILDARVFDMTNAITKGQFDDAAKVLADLLRMQEEPVYILAALSRELRRIYTARIALERGKDRMWLKSLWQMTSDYPARLLLQAAAKVNLPWCADAVKKAQVLDRRMKSEKGLDSAQELKLFLAELAGTR